MSLKEQAQDTLRILESGHYTTAAGRNVELTEALRSAAEGTVLHTPVEAAHLLRTSTDGSGPLKIEVTDETTQVAAQRLVAQERCDDLVLLNFASARNPGGGFLSGAKAQEEDLSRCSGLYPCLLTQPGYYEANRRQSSMLYTDHILYSPRVPWFRTHGRDLLDEPFLAAVITAPAPNAGQALRRDPDADPAVRRALRHRSGLVLGVAREHRHRTLLLGAWGCGVFRNDPITVADAFGSWLESETFRGAFDRVVFAVLDRTTQRKTLRAFEERFIS